VRSRSIHIHVGALVVRGLAARDRHELARVLERELARAISTDVPAMLTRDGAYERVRGGVARLGADTRGAVIGERVARVIHEGLSS
jgi:hypothetical protein